MTAGRDTWTLTKVYSKARQVAHNQRTVSLSPKGRPQGNVLVSYIHEPFLRKDNRVPTSHSNFWESLQIVRTYLELGYAVDVMSYRNRFFRPRKRYEVFVDARWNLERLAGQLNDDCIRVMHIDTSHMTFQNAAESARLLDLQRRRGVTLRPRRLEYPNLGIEYADCGVVIGNEATMSTFAYAGKPLHPVPVTSAVTFGPPDGKDFVRARTNFVWFGSGGMVHKGLDLVLEFFAGAPDLHLTVCGPVERETDFAKAYHRELYETDNITTLGWVDVDGSAFRGVLERSVGIVYPSASEGQSGAVVLCLHAGLIPICSRETGLDITEDMGIQLPDCSPGTLAAAVRSVTQRPSHELSRMARQAWARARQEHSREAFALRYRQIVEDLLSGDRQSKLVRPLGSPVRSSDDQWPSTHASQRPEAS